eukprot:TRINITY_DN28541_c0_g1_i2.p1 TRINITY_DN28541_c0_g1~~TRINITY_DN28541_c0_g1_i2.p1  ORF type:complete len:469 (+),score=17.56 TRINITY_DN28541_c0_g1_i2:71-1408(+)
MAACRGAARHETYCQYNPMSSHHVRVADICAELRHCSVIGLTGTRQRAQDTMVTSMNVDGLYVVQAGWKARGASHAGVAICFSKKHHKQLQLVNISYPEDPCIAGRILCVRSKRPHSDILFIAMYLPPQAKNSVQTSQKILNYLQLVLNKLPQRCVPIIMTDANARMGLEMHAGCQRPIVTSAVGDYGRMITNANGRLLLKFMESNNLLAYNTTQPTRPTFYSGTFSSASHIDFILGPWNLSDHIVFARTHVCSGRRLQIVDCAADVDHFPVVCKFKAQTLQYSGDNTVCRWDYAKLARSLSKGENCEGFFNKVRAGLVSRRVDIEDASANRDVDTQYAVIHSLIADAARAEYVADSPGNDDLRRTRRTLLEDRRRARLRCKHGLGHARCSIQMPDLHTMFQSWRVIAKLLQTQRAIVKHNNEQKLIDSETFKHELNAAFQRCQH